MNARSTLLAHASLSASVVGVVGVLGACGGEALRGEPPRLPVSVPVPVPAPVIDAAPASDTSPASDASSAARPEPPVSVAFVEVPARIKASLCTRSVLAVVSGRVTALGEALGAGDALVVLHGEPFDATGEGEAVWAQIAVPDCSVRARPAASRAVVRAGVASELTWAGGAMRAHLDVGSGDAGSRLSPDLYIGRLEGTAPVAEHTHPTSWEIIAAVQASGTFVLDGVSARLGPRQIVSVPPGVKHAWRPDPGARLVAIQMYAPPGPERRFLVLAAEGKDAGPSGEAGAPR